MPFVNQYDTIAAISTATGSGGIGIVRISGDNAIKITDSIFKPASGIPLSQRPTHTVNYGEIVYLNHTIDEVLVTVMKAPHSYTREDVVEINCHGGYRSVCAVLDTVLKNGARAAEPGEFTKRAFLNGRIDLSEAEAVIDIINAGTEQSRRSAMLRLKGGLSQKVKEFQDTILTLLANIEVDIDYPEHDGEIMTTEAVRQGTADIIKETESLLSKADTGRILKEGISTVILGRPNVGKSSLLNALLQEERAIVTDIPGTTRDALEESVNIGGIPVNLVDTAGIRSAEDTVEKIGVERSKQYAENAELILAVIDASSELTQEDREILELCKNKKSIVLLNKTDLAQKIYPEDINITPSAFINISVKENTGIDALGDKIKDLFMSGVVDVDKEVLVSSQRNKDSLIKAKECLQNVIDTIDAGMPEDLISIDLTQAYTYFGEITGESVEENIIDRIFSEFCLGK